MKVYKKDLYTVKVYDRDIVKGYDTEILWDGKLLAYTLSGEELDRTIQEKNLSLVSD